MRTVWEWREYNALRADPLGAGAVRLPERGGRLTAGAQSIERAFRRRSAADSATLDDRGQERMLRAGIHGRRCEDL